MRQLCKIAFALWLTFANSVFAAPVFAADEAPPTIIEMPTIEKFVGEWRSDGDAFGQPALSSMRWAPTLDGKFLHLAYKIEMRPPENEPTTFEGVAYYRDVGDNTYQAYWADSSGDLHPITAAHEGAALVSHWGVAGGKEGRTRYELVEPGKIAVTDWIKTDDGWRQFNHNIFERVAAD